MTFRVAPLSIALVLGLAACGYGTPQPESPSSESASQANAPPGGPSTADRDDPWKSGGSGPAAGSTNASGRPLASATKGGDAKPGKPGKAKEAPKTQGVIQLVPEGMKWSMRRADIESLVDRFIDEDARESFKKTQPGPAMRDLEAKVAGQKAAFRRSYIDLTPGPLGLDASPIADEYSKGNGEALMSHVRGPGVRIWFFFINGRLWKTLEEVTLVEGGLYGKSLEDAALKLVDSVGGTLPRTTPADPDHGRYFVMNDWQDDVTHMRVWDRAGTLMVVREEKSTVGSLGNLRRIRANADGEKLDPNVSSVLRPKEPEPPPLPETPPADKKGPKKKKLGGACFAGLAGSPRSSRSPRAGARGAKGRRKARRALGARRAPRARSARLAPKTCRPSRARRGSRRLARLRWRSFEARCASIAGRPRSSTKRRGSS